MSPKHRIIGGMILTKFKAQPIIDAVYIACQAIGFLEKMGLYQDFVKIIAEHPEDLPSLTSLHATYKRLGDKS